MKNSKTFPAKLDNYENMLSFIKNSAIEFGFKIEELSGIEIACEEALVNIINYAYPESTGDISIVCSISEDSNGIEIVLADSGVSYNPLKKKDPDINVPVNERDIGGLGIFMIKKIMDVVEYQRVDKKNILKMVKFK